MSAARDEVLRRVRNAIGSSPAAPAPRAYRGSSEGSGGAVVERFVDRVGDDRATIARIDSASLPTRLASCSRASTGSACRQSCRRRGSATSSRSQQRVVDHRWPRPTGFRGHRRSTIAETGTIVLDGPADQGRRALTLLPDHHACIVPEDRIVASMPEGLAGVDPTRSLTLINGPSATSHIEFDRVEGVHGLRRLDVRVVALPTVPR